MWKFSWTVFNLKSFLIFLIQKVEITIWFNVNFNN